MNHLPPDTEDDAQIDALYRRMSAAAASAPPEAVRQAVLTHAAGQVGQAVNDAERAPGYRWQRPRRGWGRPAAFGALAAGILAAFMLGPRWPGPPQGAMVARLQPVEPAATVGYAAGVEPTQPYPSPTMQPTGKARPASAPRPPPDRPTALEAPAGGGAASAAAAAPPPSTSGGLERYAAQNSARASADAAPAAAPAKERAHARAGDEVNVTLWHAAETGDLAGLRELHDRQADLNVTDSAGRTALMIATLHGHSQAVAALLDYGADPNIADAGGESPLDAAMAADESEIIAVLRRHGAR